MLRRLRRGKQPRRPRAALRLVGGDRRKMIGERLARRVVQRHEALASAFALDGHHLVVADEHAAREPNQLRDAQARGVKRLEQRVEAERPALGRRLRLPAPPLAPRSRAGSRPRQATGASATAVRASGCRSPSRDRRRAMPSAKQEAEELAHGRELARPRGGGETLAAELGEIGAHSVGRSVARGLPLGGKEGKKLAEVAGVGLDGLRGGAALGHQHVEEQRKLRLVAASGSAFRAQGLRPFRAKANGRRAPRRRDAALPRRARRASAPASHRRARSDGRLADRQARTPRRRAEWCGRSRRRPPPPSTC